MIASRLGGGTWCVKRGAYFHGAPLFSQRNLREVVTMPETFITAGKIITGCKGLEAVGKECAALGKHCLIVTGPSAMKRAGITLLDSSQIL